MDGGHRINNNFKTRSKLSKSEEIKSKISQSCKGNKNGAIPIVINGIRYPSLTDASKSLRVSEYTIRKWMREGSAVTLKTQNPGKYRSIKVKIDEQIFDSKESAKIALGISSGILAKWVKSGKAHIIS